MRAVGTAVAAVACRGPRDRPDRGPRGAPGHATGRLTAKPTKATSGDITFVLERDGGVPGQGHGRCLQPRDGGRPQGRDDVPGRRRRGPAGDTIGCARRLSDLGPRRRRHRGDRRRRAIGSPSPTPSGSAGSRRHVSIAKALRITDRDVAIEAVVTAPATLLDTTGRRIVVQDAIGRHRGPPPVGRGRPAGREPDPGRGPDRCRVWRAPTPRRPSTGSRAAATSRNRSSSTARRPRRTNGGLSRSRAASRASRSSATDGAPRSRSERRRSPSSDSRAPGSRATTLAEGRTATVIGIARRPFPSASDKRFAVTPRFAADVRVSGRAAPETDEDRPRQDRPPRRSAGVGSETIGRADDRRRPRRPRDRRRANGAGRWPRRGPPCRRLHASMTGRRSVESCSAAPPSTACRSSSRTTRSTRSAGSRSTADGARRRRRRPGRDRPGGRPGRRGAVGRGDLRRGRPRPSQRRPRRPRRPPAAQPDRRSRWPAAVRRGRRRARDPPRHLGGIARRDAPPSRAVEATPGDPDRRSAGHVRGRSGGPRRGRHRTHARLSVGQARSTRLDAREKAGLSSAEFRASEAAT